MSDTFILNESVGVKFSFSTKFKGAQLAHKVTFDFSETKSSSERIAIIIGKNGTGKTSYLKNLALRVSGESKDLKVGLLSPERPITGPTIMVSYSVFDNFELPKMKDNAYIYCGLNLNGEKITHESILKDVESNLLDLRGSKKKNKFLDILKKSQLYNDEHLALNENTFRVAPLSSGQAILLKILTDIVKNIQENSLILIDEIETHLHPNYLIELLRVLADTLQEFNSYCILSTHSPIVVQEIDVNRAVIFSRDGRDVQVYTKEKSYIAESLGLISDEIFEITPRDHLYTSILKDNLLSAASVEKLNPLALLIRGKN